MMIVRVTPILATLGYAKVVAEFASLGGEIVEIASSVLC